MRCSLSRFRGPNPHGAGPPGGPSILAGMRRLPDGLSGEGAEVASPPPPPIYRMPVRAPSVRGGRGRGGKRGRPRLDPDTDLDFSPEPSTNAHNEMLLARLQQAGMTVSPVSAPKSNSGNES